MRLTGRRVHIAGSASRKADPARVSHAHKIVRWLVRDVLKAGATLVVQAGPEPHFIPDDPKSPALVFDWTIMEEVRRCLNAGMVEPSINGAPLLFAVSSEKATADMPEARVRLWDDLLESGAAWLEHIRPGSRSATVIRELQARQGNALVILGGGAGVEHLAEMYARHQRPILPLDARLGASRDDGVLGGEGIARMALQEPTRFFHLQMPSTEATRLAALSTREGTADPQRLAQRIVAVMADLTPPIAFFVRLVDQTHPDFRAVESFFRDVVEPVIAAAGYQRHEVGKDAASSAFINVEIFAELHHSPLVIADLTGHRPNCFMELGYALRGEAKVLVTAKEGTSRPFDTAAIPWHFWNDTEEDNVRRGAFEEFWRRNAKALPLVQTTVPF